MHEQSALRQISSADLALLGLEQVAYVKSVTLEHGGAGYAVHAADGQEVAVMADREVAFAMVKQHDLEPVSVH